MGIYYVIPLLLINGTALFLFLLSVSPKIKAKNLSSIMICLGINLITSPAAFLIGGIADYAGGRLIMGLILRVSRQQRLL